MAGAMGMSNPEAVGEAHHSSGRLLEVTAWLFWEEKQAVHPFFFFLTFFFFIPPPLLASVVGNSKGLSCPFLFVSRGSCRVGVDCGYSAELSGWGRYEGEQRGIHVVNLWKLLV